MLNGSFSFCNVSIYSFKSNLAKKGSVHNTQFSERKCHLLIFFFTVRCKSRKKRATAFALSPLSSPSPSFFWRQWFAITILFLRTPEEGERRVGTQTDSRHDKRKEGGGGEPSLFIMGPGHGRKKGKCPRSGSNAFSHKKTYVLRRREKGNGENKSQAWALLAPSAPRLQKATI